MNRLCGVSRRLNLTTWSHCCKPPNHRGKHRVYDDNGKPITW